MLLDDRLNDVAAPRASTPPAQPKRVAIVGGGVGGIGALKALLDVPSTAREHWVIDLYEERDTLGGVWIPESSPAVPPALPETPLYPDLRTNNPHPTMHFPGYPYPAGTNLFPSWTVVNAYLKDFVQKTALARYCHLSSSVLDASYDADAKWTLQIASAQGTQVKSYDHLISAIGHNHFPLVPKFDGQDLWEGEGKTVQHSIYFRHPTQYRDQIAVVVGNGPTGHDEADRLAKAGATVYHSYSSNPLNWPPLPHVHLKPRISHFTPTSIVFVDGTSLTSDTQPITVFLGTGYELRIPYLSSLLAVNPTSSGTPTSLETNLRKVGPLHQSLFAIDDRLPFDALAFVGLPVAVDYAYNAYAQGLYIEHVLCDPSLLPTKEAARAELRRSEEELREAGHEPLWIGHRFPLPHRTNEDYLDALIAHLRKSSPTPLPPSLAADSRLPYVELEIRYIREHFLAVQTAWLRAEEEGVEGRFMPVGQSLEEWRVKVDELLEWSRSL